MKLPNLSNMVNVGQLRYIQSIYETAEYRNPDTMVGDFLPVWQRWGGKVRGRVGLASLRSHRFYYYVLARTRYYDDIFLDAIRDGVRWIVNIGCGSDTRAYRFGDALKQKGIKVLECDQPEAIRSKRQIASRLGPIHHVEYSAIDLNDDSWPDFESWLKQNSGSRVLVLMEGVSPYINDDSFGRFLDLLAKRLGPGSRVAYDFKLRGVAEDFGSSDRTLRPFRLPEAWDEVAAYHAAHGFQLEHLVSSSELTLRLLPTLLANAGVSLFRQDALVRLQPA